MSAKQKADNCKTGIKECLITANDHTYIIVTHENYIHNRMLVFFTYFMFTQKTLHSNEYHQPKMISGLSADLSNASNIMLQQI